MMRVVLYRVCFSSINITNYQGYTNNIILGRDTKIWTSVFRLIQECVAEFSRPAVHAGRSAKKMHPSTIQGWLPRWNATDVKNTGSRRCWKSRGERAGLNERDESQSTRYGRERDGGSWKREEWNRAQLGESRWQERKGRKARMGGTKGYAS